MTRFGLVIFKENNHFRVTSRSLGMSQAEVIMVASEWIRAYKDDFRNSLSVELFDDSDDTEE